jgi:hypothetical protein
MVPRSVYEDGQCTGFTKWPSLATQRGVGLFTIVLQFFIPLIIITFAYTKIVLQLRKGVGTNRTQASDNPQDAKRERIMKRARMNVVKTLVMVAVSFVVCWSPNQIIYTMFNCGFKVDFSSTFYHFTVILAFANCCINPFIYAFQYDQFKSVLFRSCRKADHSRESSVITATSVAMVRKPAGTNGQISNGKDKNGEFDNVCYEGES